MASAPEGRRGAVFLRSAFIRGRPPAFCILLVPFCSVLHELGHVFLHSSLMWCRFAAFCLYLASFCCRLQRLGVHSLEDELIL